MIKKVKELLNIEEDFFDLDKENKIAHMKLEFDNPDSIFDKNSLTKIPIFTDDFIERIQAAFEYTPRGYKIDLDIAFADMDTYSEEDLKNYFTKNTLLEMQRSQRKMNTKKIIAWALVIMGVISLIFLLLFTTLWSNEGAVKDVFIYIFDIATTVTFWEALTILVVENTERNAYLKSLKKKFHSIKFHKK